jgi:glycine/D-amino acid oxidase-like deaminating enzyme
MSLLGGELDQEQEVAKAHPGHQAIRQGLTGRGLLASPLTPRAVAAWLLGSSHG